MRVVKRVFPTSNYRIFTCTSGYIISYFAFENVTLQRAIPCLLQEKERTDEELI